MKKPVYKLEDLAYLLGTEEADLVRDFLISQLGQKAGLETIVSFNDLGIAFGDLGNQLFQVAAVIAFAKFHGLTPKIPNPASNVFKQMGIKLTCFDIPKNMYIDEHLKSCITLGELGHNFRKLANLHQFFLVRPIITNSKWNVEQGVNPQNINLSGFYQNWILPAYVKKELKQILKFKNQYDNKAKFIVDSLKKKYPNQKIVAVHVRLGDTTTYDAIHRYCRIGKDYYDRSFERMRKEIGTNVKFLIVSDEPKKCKSLLDDPDIIYCDELFTDHKDLEKKFNDYNVANIWSHPDQDTEAFFVAPVDLAIMTKCDSIIIANSTFSWWGAFLGNHEHVIAPTRSLWFGIQNSFKNVSDLYPPDWEEVWYRQDPSRPKFDLNFLSKVNNEYADYIENPELKNEKNFL